MLGSWLFGSEGMEALSVERAGERGRGKEGMELRSSFNAGDVSPSLPRVTSSQHPEPISIFFPAHHT